MREGTELGLAAKSYIGISHMRTERGIAEVRNSCKDTDRTCTELGWIIILLTPAPIIDLFRAWKPLLCHKEQAKGKKCPLEDALGALSCVFMS